MKIMPAIDLMDEKVVRLSKGEFDSKKIYSDEPDEQARKFERAGFDLLHIVDLQGSRDGGSPNLEVVKKIIRKRKNISVQLGGGVRSVKDVYKHLTLGIKKVVIGSMSVTDADAMKLIADDNLQDHVVIATDIYKNKIVTHGWTNKTDISIDEHITRMQALGYKNYLCTDVSKDGMLAGPNYDLYKMLADKFSEINVIASGGISCIDDLEKLKNENLFACVVGKSIYEKKLSLKELREIAD